MDENSVLIDSRFNLQAKEIGTRMLELWDLMDTPHEEQQNFHHVTCLIGASEEEIVHPSTLSVETLEEVGHFYT